jgi:uncharacterized membrane-anchored protein
MRRISLRSTLLFHCAVWGVYAANLGAQSGAESPFAKVQWVDGPIRGQLGAQAAVAVPATCRFTGTAGAKLFMEATQNPVSGNEVGILLCRTANVDSSGWFVVFEYNATGLIKDDEKTSLDQAAILKSIQGGTEASNEERRKRGWDELEVVGWQREPYYDPATHNLTWSTRVKSKRSPNESVNHSVRLLGREGVMNADLVADPSEVAAAVAGFDEILKGYDYTDGHKYSQWRAGDKVAKYGLTALIAGGAGAAALKLGLFGKLWRLIIVVVLALKKAVILVAVAISAFFKKLFRKKEAPAPQPKT